MRFNIRVAGVLSIIIIIISFSCRALCEESGVNYKLPINEKLVFKIKALRLSIATQTNSTRGIQERDGRKCVNLFSNVKTNKWVLLYGIDNTMESCVDVETLKPLYYEERANEKDWKAVESITFSDTGMKYTAKKGMELDREEEVAHSYEPENWPQDELSMTYYVRQLPLEVGKKFKLMVAVDDKYEEATVEVVKKTGIKTIHGKKEVFIVTSTVGDSIFHIGADEKRIPYRFEVTLNFGVAQGTLTEYSND